MRKHIALTFLVTACGPTNQKSETAPSVARVGRQHIDIVGSSTVYPFATVVAETFGKATKFKTPKVEATGSGGGLKLFCAGVGADHPDIANASRRIKQSEIDTCKSNGVDDIVEVKIGYDGIVFAHSKRSEGFAVSRRDIWLALAKDVPAPDGGERLVPNPHRRWNEVNPALPDRTIEVLGPPPTSGTRDAFVELAMEGGCKTFGWIAALKRTNEPRYESVCHTIREDGRFIEAGENDNLIVQKLAANPNAHGIFGYNFLDQNSDKVRGATIDGVAPTFETIAAGTYPVSRPLYFYLKKAHARVIPGLEAFVDEFASEHAWGPDGYLAEKGMIPMPDEERERLATTARELRHLVALH